MICNPFSKCLSTTWTLTTLADVRHKNLEWKIFQLNCLLQSWLKLAQSCESPLAPDTSLNETKVHHTTVWNTNFSSQDPGSLHAAVGVVRDKLNHHLRFKKPPTS
eukprot:3337244-Amphidinium_carterae.1